jgi:hypothetical protein
MHRRGDRDAGDERCTSEVSRDHQSPTSPNAIEPDAGRQGEEQVREQADRGQRPHLRGVGAQRQDRDQRQPELRDLVAEDRDRLADPEPPEVGRVVEERREEPADRA